MGVMVTLLGKAIQMFKNNTPNVLRKNVLEQHHPGALATLKGVVPASHYTFLV